MAKAKILNTNGYLGAKLIVGNVVSCDIFNHPDTGETVGVDVAGSELVKTGAESRVFDCDYKYFFPIECIEIIEE